MTRADLASELIHEHGYGPVEAHELIASGRAKEVVHEQQ